MTRPVRVIKVGGSLFDWEGLRTKLAAWLAAQSDCQNVLIAGGGKLADAIREADRIHRIGDETGHWLCVQLLDVSAQLLACLLPGARLVRQFAELQAGIEQEPSDCWILSVEEFMRRWEPAVSGRSLPHDWCTSSDAIAARAAQALSATELVLVKSRDLPPGTTREAAAAEGFVDAVLPQAARGLSVHWVNLRSGVAGQLH